MTDKFHIIIPPQDIACDPGLQKRLANGDRAAFAWVYKNYCQRLFDYALLMTSDAEKSEDIVQDVFIRLWEKREKIREVENFNGYINTICRNQIVNEFRKDKRETEVRKTYATQLFRTVKTVDDYINYKETQQLLSGELERLSEQPRIVIKLSREDGLRPREIAKKLNKAEKTVKGQLYEGLKLVRERLSHHYWS